MKRDLDVACDDNDNNIMIVMCRMYVYVQIDMENGRETHLKISAMLLRAYACSYIPAGRNNTRFSRAAHYHNAIVRPRTYTV